MMGRLESVQDQFFYNFRLDDIVPADHLVRRRAWRGFVRLNFWSFL